MTGSVKQPPELKRRTLSTRQKSQHNFSLGNTGEQQALTFLVQQNFEVLGQNIRFGNNEVDIVAIDRQVSELVFIEVKTRSSGYYGDPSRAVDKKKLRSMQYVARCYLRKTNLDKDYRFDIITVLPGKIRHYQNVTWSP